MAKGEVRLKLDMEIDQAKKNIKDFYSLMEKTSKQLTEVQDKINKRDKDDFSQVLSKNLEKTTGKLEKYKEQLLKLKEEQKKSIDEINKKQDDLNNKNEDSYKKILKYEEEIKESQYDLSRLDTRASASKRIKNLQGLINEENSKIKSNDSELKNLASQKEEIENNEKIKQIGEECEEIFKERQRIIEETTNAYNAETDVLRDQEAELTKSLNMQASGMEEDIKTLNKLDSPFSKMKARIKDIGTSIGELGTKVLNLAGGAFKKLGGVLGQIKTKFDGIFHKNSTSSLQNGMSSLLGTTKRFAMSLLGAYSAYSLISKAVNQIKEQNQDLANTMNTLWNGLVSLVTPVVNALVNAFATALNYIIKIASVISGINILGKLKTANKKANAKSGSGGSNTSKLYSFDTSETLKKDSSGSSGTTENTEGLLKDLELSDKLKGYAEKLKTIWDNIKQIGANLVDRIKEGLKYMNSGERIMAVLDKLANAFLDDWIEITEATLKWSETIDFGPLFDSIATVLESLEPILEKIGDLFVWLWINCVLPLASYLIERLIPAINNTLAPALDILNQILGVLGSTLLKLWNDTLKPMFEAIGNDLIEKLNKIKTFLEGIRDSGEAIKVFKTIFESLADVIRALTPYVEELGNLIDWIFTEIIVPLASWMLTDLIPAVANFTAMLLEFISMVLEPLKELLLLVWEVIIKPLAEFLAGIFVDVLNLITEVVGENKDKFQELYEKLAVIFKFLREELAPFVKEALNNLRELFNTIMEGILSSLGDTIDGITLALNGVIEFLTGVFTGDWEKAWQGVKDIFGGIWNAILGIVEGVLNGMVNGINWIVDKMNSLSFDLPDVLGGGHIGFSLSHVSQVDLSSWKYVPALAQGAVIPPNKEFLAMLGDQTRGRNIEAPEELIREIVSEESGTQEINIVANGTMSQLIKLLRLELQKEDKRVGTSLVVGG